MQHLEVSGAVRHIYILYVIRRLKVNTSSGMISLCDCLVCRSGIPSSHLHRLIIPDDVLIQFDLLIMITMMLETRREAEINKYMRKCVKLVISKNL